MQYSNLLSLLIRNSYKYNGITVRFVRRTTKAYNVDIYNQRCTQLLTCNSDFIYRENNSRTKPMYDINPGLLQPRGHLEIYK